jgi:hypothetical protein
MDNIVFLNDEFQLAVCKACKSAVWGNVRRHFSDQYKETWRSHKKELKAHIAKMALADVNDV